MQRTRFQRGELSSERLHVWLSTGHAVKPAVFYDVSIECSVTVNRGKIENSVKNSDRFNFLNSPCILDFYILMIVFSFFFFLREQKNTESKLRRFITGEVDRD